MKTYILSLFVLIMLCFGALNIYAWKSPTRPAPAGGIDAPVTALVMDQIKNGTLGVSGMFAVFGNSVFTGGFKIADGTQREFYALTSDSAGNATWTRLPAKPVAVHKLSLGDCPPGSTKMTDRGLPYCGYWVNTGVASYCKPGDTRIAAVDTGTSGHKGGNHGITLVEPNGCIGWEGASNFGGAGCAVQCRAKTTYN